MILGVFSTLVVYFLSPISFFARKFGNAARFFIPSFVLKNSNKGKPNPDDSVPSISRKVNINDVNVQDTADQATPTSVDQGHQSIGASHIEQTSIKSNNNTTNVGIEITDAKVVSKQSCSAIGDNNINLVKREKQVVKQEGGIVPTPTPNPNPKCKTKINLDEIMCENDTCVGIVEGSKDVAAVVVVEEATKDYLKVKGNEPYEDLNENKLGLKVERSKDVAAVVVEEEATKDNLKVKGNEPYKDLNENKLGLAVMSGDLVVTPKAGGETESKVGLVDDVEANLKIKDDKLGKDLAENKGIAAQVGGVVADAVGGLGDLVVTPTSEGLDKNKNKFIRRSLSSFRSPHRKAYLNSRFKGRSLSIQFHDAVHAFSHIENDDLDALTELLEKQSIDVNDTSMGKSLLHAASRSGNERICQYLLEQGAEVDMKDETCGRTALDLACNGGHLAVLQVLLTFKASTDIVSDDGKIMLHHACQHGDNIDVVRFLYVNCNGMDLNAKDSLGSTPLVHAVMADDLDVAEFLIWKGACKDVSNHLGYTLVDLTDSDEMLEVLAETNNEMMAANRSMENDSEFEEEEDSEFAGEESDV